mmetsp:Transcript_1770/g.3894  ORF Transcript_1770/g.3894 Transcript_1770/m.3894 type:complete len:279 (-) Transcript_1770:2185-3021(-)
MVFTDEDRRPLEVLVIRIQEESTQVVRVTRGVHAIGETLLEELPKVIPRCILHQLWLAHGPPQGQHLPQSRMTPSRRTFKTLGKREGHSKVWSCSCHACILLCLEDPIEGTDEGPEKVCHVAMELGVWLVHENHSLQSRMVAPLASGGLEQEPPLQHGGVLLLHLLKTVQSGVQATPWHLQVQVVTDASDDAQAVPLCLIQKLAVVNGGVRAIETHSVGTQPAHDPEIPAANSFLARLATAPEDLGISGHEVTASVPNTRRLDGRRVIANALDEAVTA